MKNVKTCQRGIPTSKRLSPRGLSWLRAAGVLLLSLLVVSSAKARTWDGGAGNGSWNTGGANKNNWDGNNNYLAGQDVIFAGSVQTNVTIGSTALTSGSITFSNNASPFTIGGTATLTINGGVVNNDSDTQSFTVPIALGTAQTWNAAAGNLSFSGNVTNAGFLLTIDGANITTISGVISGSEGLTKNGAGTLTLSGGSANTYAGLTTVNLGTLILNKSSGDAIAGDLTIAGGTVQLNAANQISNTKTVTVSGGSLDVQTFNDTVSVFNMSSGSLGGSGTLTATTYGLSGGTVTANLGTGTLNSSGTVALNGTAGASAVNVTAGTLTLGSANRLADGSTVTVSGGSLNVQTFDDTVSVFNMSSGSLGGSSGTLTAATYGLSGGTVTANLGAGTLNSSGTVALNGTAGASAVNVTAGTLTLGSSDRLSDSAAVTLSGGGTLALGANSDTVGSVSLQNGAITGSGTLTSGSTFDMQNGTVSANLGGAVGLTKTTASNVTLSGANTYTGVTTVNGGILLLNNANALPGGIGASGGTSALTISGGVVGLGNGDFTRDLGTTASTVQFTGSGGFAAYGADRNVNLGGLSATVTWDSGSFVPTDSALILGASDADKTVDFQNPINFGLNTTGTVQADNGTAAIDGILSGVLTGIGTSGLTKTGSGTLALTGNNTYAGDTTINAGALNIQHANALGSAITAGTTVNNGAALQIQGGITIVGEALTLNGAGASSDGALRNISGNNTYAGAITLNTASRINSDGGTLTLSLGVSGGSALTVGGAGNVTVSTVGISGGTSLTKDGAGTLALNVASTYIGGTTLSNGKIALGADNALGGSSSGFTFAGGVLDSQNNSFSIGALSLTANSTLNLGAGDTTADLRFNSATWTAGILTINNWSGTPGPSGFGDDNQIFITTTPNADFLYNIHFKIGGELFFGVMSGDELVAGVTPVPEPINVALGVFGVVFAGVGFARRLRARRSVVES